MLVDMNAPWGTADNYNPARPFPAIDQVALAVRATDRSGRAASRGKGQTDGGGVTVANISH